VVVTLLPVDHLDALDPRQRALDTSTPTWRFFEDGATSMRCGTSSTDGEDETHALLSAHQTIFKCAQILSRRIVGLVWQHVDVRYRYEDLGDKEFQQLIQALLAHAYGPDVRAMPLGQADGGRDAVQGTVVYQVKFTNGPEKVQDPVGWLLKALDGESGKIAALVARGARTYCLVTNVGGTGKLDTGSIDRLDAELASRSAAWGIRLTCWWRDDVDARMSSAPVDVVRSFIKVLPPDQIAAWARQLASARPTWDAHGTAVGVGDPAIHTDGSPGHSRGFLVPPVTTVPVDAPYGRLPSIVRGRAVEVQRLVAPSQRTVQVLCGMGGVGKTTVALQAADIGRAQGSRVFWINASSAASVAEGLQAVALAVGVPEPAIAQAWTHGDRAAADLLWRYLATWERAWMLVFDSADDLDILSCPGTALRDATGWVRPPTGNGVAVIVTTRDRSSTPWGPRLATVTDVANLDDRAAAEVLLDLAPQAGDVREARRLATRLGNLPLALQLAGSYLSAAHDDPLAVARTFVDYDRVLADAPMRIDDANSQVAGDRRPDDERARESVARTWELSLQLLEARQCGPVRATLRLLSCFAPNVPLPKPFVEPERLASAPAWAGDTSAAEIGTALAGLRRFGLLDVVAVDGEPAYQVHPLVAEVSTAKLADDAASQKSTLTTAYVLLVAETPAAGRDPQHWPTFVHAAKHWPEMIRRMPSVLPADVAELVITYACTAINYHRARAQFRTAEDIAKGALQHCDSTTMSALARLGIRYQRALVFRDMGDLAQAEAEFREISEDARKEDAREDEDARPLNLAARFELAAVLQRRGKYVDAEREFTEVLEGETVEFGPTAHTTLLTRHDRAVTIRALGRLSEASEEIAYVARELAWALR
jgi:tetratricopeptide (TPR) repeat protein